MLAVLLAVACAHATRPNPDALREELIALKNEDQAVRQRWLKDQKNEGLIAEMHAGDVKRLARVREIIRELGTWPGASLVGEKASGAAWTIVQHADRETIHKLLPLMQRAAEKNELSYGLVATTIDRDLVSHGKKQTYGTQFDTQGDKCEPMPIEDPEHVDERRKHAGLDTLREYTEMLCRVYKH